MSKPHAHSEHPVLLPSSLAFSSDTRLVGEVLGTVASAAARTADDTRFLAPALTWQIAAKAVGDLATDDHSPENLRAASVPVYALEAVRACRAALVEASGSSPGSDGARLADLLSDYLEVVHETDLRGVIAVLERILAVLALDLPSADILLTRLLLQQEVSPGHRAVLDDVLVAWRNAGVDC
ncbi:hypothetical protein [Streptacidiphilus sp. EB103A]|uniref:hypothetical protein n=1 Tax=Streptacidiphilus sp. EB103A TaxID=3156275 RepID=UPI003515B294